MTSEGRKPGIGICWFLGAWLIFFPLARAQTAVGGTGFSALAVKSTWLPPDVDERVPPVEVGTACSLDEVVQKAEKRILEFVQDVDRFTATESLTHESIDKHGSPSAQQKRKFNYVVSIQEVRPGHLGVTEYRNGGEPRTNFPTELSPTGYRHC